MLSLEGAVSQDKATVWPGVDVSDLALVSVPVVTSPRAAFQTHGLNEPSAEEVKVVVFSLPRGSLTAGGGSHPGSFKSHSKSFC